MLDIRADGEALIPHRAEDAAITRASIGEGGQGAALLLCEARGHSEVDQQLVKEGNEAMLSGMAGAKPNYDAKPRERTGVVQEALRTHVERVGVPLTEGAA